MASQRFFHVGAASTLSWSVMEVGLAPEVFASLDLRLIAETPFGVKEIKP
jgi:hypothetical protein